jgi:hypothetical protein
MWVWNYAEPRIHDFLDNTNTCRQLYGEDSCNTEMPVVKETRRLSAPFAEGFEPLSGGLTEG